MTSATKSPYAGYRFPGEVISHAVWLYFRFPLSLRMVEEMLAARGIDVSHETVRQWGRKFGQAFANQIRRRLPCPGDKESIRMSGVFTPRRLEQRRFRCRWRDLDTSARTTAGACRQASACASAAASGRRVWSTASADA